MAEKTNKELLGIVEIEDVMALYEKLSPWEQKDFSDKFGTDFSEMSEENILNYFGIDPIDHVDERDVRDAFGDSILEEYRAYEICEEMERRLWEIDASDIIDLLAGKVGEEANKRRYFTLEDVDRLEKIVSELKEKLNNEDKKTKLL
jgi:hypothetical protein